MQQHTAKKRQYSNSIYFEGNGKLYSTDYSATRSLLVSSHRVGWREKPALMPENSPRVLLNKSQTSWWSAPAPKVRGISGRDRDGQVWNMAPSANTHVPHQGSLSELGNGLGAPLRLRMKWSVMSQGRLCVCA